MQKSSKLGYFDLSMIVVSLVIGMGIFQTPVDVAKAANTPFIFFLAWSLGGVFALCGGLTFAEIGSRLPVSGGYYRIFAHCYHPAFAFMLNGTILFSNAASVAGVALIGAQYISGVLFPGYSETQREHIHLLIAFGEIVLFFGLNLLGLRTSAKTLNILVIFKIIVVILLCTAIFFPAHPLPRLAMGGTLFHTTGFGPSAPLPFLLSLGLCLIPISFTYGGYQQTINFGGEVNNATRIIPRSIISGMLLVLVLYLTINFAYYSVIGFDHLKTADSIARIMATRIFGSRGGQILTLLLFFSVLAYVNVGLMSNPRVICAMSEEGTLPPLFSRYSKRFNVPVAALISFTAASLIILFFAKTFHELVKYVIFLDSIGFIAAAATIFILRKKQGPRTGEIYKMKLYPLLPLLFIASYAFVTAAVVLDNWTYALFGVGIAVIFLGLYFLYAFVKKAGA